MAAITRRHRFGICLFQSPSTRHGASIQDNTLCLLGPTPNQALKRAAMGHFQSGEDECGFCREVLKTIAAVAKIEHTSLRNAVLEEIVGLLRRVNNPVFVTIKPDSER